MYRQIGKPEHLFGICRATLTKVVAKGRLEFSYDRYFIAKALNIWLKHELFAKIK